MPLKKDYVGFQEPIYQIISICHGNVHCSAGGWPQLHVSTWSVSLVFCGLYKDNKQVCFLVSHVIIRTPGTADALQTSAIYPAFATSAAGQDELLGVVPGARVH